MEHRFFGILAAILMAGSAAAGPFEEAIQALDQGDLTTSEELLIKAAEGGNVTAQNLLGSMYTNGYLEIRRDPGEAVKWYRMAANQSDGEAQFRLGISHENGQGAPRDVVLAHMWYSLASAAGHNRAGQSRENIAGRMSETQLTEARRLAREWAPETR